MASAKTIGRMMKEFGTEAMLGVSKLVFRLMFPVERKPVVHAAWWQKPGFGIQYQIEYRPGYEWERDFAEFNRRMKDANGALKFNGPFCKVAQWVALSREVGADYHMMESKWHDGICYFNTHLTNWKTEIDYAGQFAELSRQAGIPFLYYYSSVFDHNPQFDAIQPNPHSTFSVIALETQPVYEQYLREQYREIMEQYQPDGMWIDWYWPDQSTRTTIDFFKTNYPKLVLAFNMSNLFTSSYEKLNYTSSEAHDLDGPFVKLVRSEGAYLPVFCSAWKWSTIGRRMHAHPSEIITPSGRWWSDPSLRDDPYDLIRMAAIVMASGGKFCTGVTERLDGGLYPDQVKQLRLLGAWYVPRKGMFTGSFPLRYRGSEPSTIRVHPRSFKTIACCHGEDTLIHLINMDSATRPITIQFCSKAWSGITSIVMEPAGRELPITRSGNKMLVTIKEDIDPIDVILRLKR